MSIVSEWNDDERTIINVQFNEGWSWDNIGDVRAEVVDMLQSVSHTVDFLCDFRNVDRIPGGSLAIGRIIHNSRLPNEGVFIIIGTSPILKVLFRSFTAAYPMAKVYLRTATSMEEAIEILSEVKKNRDNG